MLPYPKKRSPLVLCFLIALLAVALIAGGCGKNDSPPPSDEPEIGAEPKEQTETVTLYFSDNQAMYLVPEEREVTRTSEPLEEVMVKELIKGPAAEENLPTIPPEATLISISVNDGVAYLNFSKELQTKHWGGSAGEMMTIYSVANSLEGVNGIEKVQFLVDGEKQDSLLGHAFTAEPIAANWDMVKK